MNHNPNFDAVIFDLDGVITQTALVHGSAWKKTFDGYLKSREERFGEPFREFTHAGDYLPFVDGKPRYKGVASFLESRGIEIPYGDPSDDPDKETVCGLGNRKNYLFNEVLREEGVKVYESTVELIHELKKAGIKIGVASSSKNCKPVLEAAGLLDLFETRIDGVVSAEIGLHGKPEPDIFTTACDRLGGAYHRSVVVEDAVSGVQAGKNGNFGLVIGVAREDNRRELLIGGGDIIVEDMGEVSLERINEWFAKGLKEEGYTLRYYDYDLTSERSREALLTVGNGYFGTRGAMEESRANDVNYPGTYISGLYNRLTSKVSGREIENEDFVNIINWLPVKMRVNGRQWFGFSPDPTMEIVEIERMLNFRNGELTREMVLKDSQGRLTKVVSSRFASMADPHRAALRYAVTPLNYSGRIDVRTELRGDHLNAGVKRYNDLNQKHLKPTKEEASDDRALLVVKTTASERIISAACRMRFYSGSFIEPEQESKSSPGKVSHIYSAEVGKGEELVLEKLVSVYTSADPGVQDPVAESAANCSGMTNYESQLKESEESWEKIWKRIDIIISGDRAVQKLVRLHLYHMMVTASPHHAELDSGIPPRGLHGEAYRGHIFWDELYILPLYNIHFPEVVRSVLMYRYRRLDRAREYAREHGCRGAMFPWQSGSDGREETQVIHLNPLSGEWGDDYSSLQRHVSLAIAFNTWNYFHITNDAGFMQDYGAELFLDICQFWASMCRFDPDDGRYHIDRVMGPDEFHEKMPGSDEGGLTDNAYTNIMVSWLLERGLHLTGIMDQSRKDQILGRLSIDNEMLSEWEKISRGLALHISEEGIISHFKGYFDLMELDWDDYRNKYDDIHRLDRILKAEGKSPDDYKLSKQADLLMAFFNLGEEEVTRIVRGLGYYVPDDYFRRNFDYYISRTSHGSTLSRLVHGRLAFRLGMHGEGWKLFLEALKSDLVDIQGGTTGEGIHCGVMAGTVYEVISTFGGVNLRGEQPAINPDLPEHWSNLVFRFSFRNRDYHLSITGREVKCSVTGQVNEKLKVTVYGHETEPEPNREQMSANH
ncbi:MAG: HAD-IA family hydrolase [Bacteroidales bacterium]|nr:HAD-IA family hydrolase [Bacteroidales bacterium]